MSDRDALLLQVSADLRSLERQMKKAGDVVDKGATKAEQRAKIAGKKIGDGFAEGLNRISAVSAIAFAGITAYAVNAAQRAEAVSGAFAQTFRDMPKEAAAATQEIASKFGRLETDIKDNFTQLRSVMVALGVDAKTSLTLVDQLQRRSLDMAAFKDVSDADAFRAVISGITGETEPLKRFGVVLNETALKAELLRMGFKGNAAAAPEATKAIARANIVLRQTAEMAGQVSRESDTLSEKQKQTRAEFTKAAEVLGTEFLPIAKQVVTWAGSAVKAFNAMPSGVQVASLSLIGLAAASGPIMAVVNTLKVLIATTTAARVALAGLATAKAGAAGGVALGGVGALGVGALAIGSATGSDDIAGVTANRLTRDKSVKTQLAQMAASDKEIEQAIQWLSGTGRKRGKNLDKIATLQALQAQRAGAGAKGAAYQADQETKRALAEVERALKDTRPPAASTGSSGRRTGGQSAAKAEADRLEAEMKEYIDQIAAGLGESWKLAGEKFQATVLNIDNSPAGFMAAGEGLPDLVNARDGSLVSPEQLEEMERGLHDSWSNAIEGGIWAAIQGGAPGIAEYFAQTLTEALVANMADDLAALLTSFGKGSGAGGGGGLGILGSIAGAIIGGLGGSGKLGQKVGSYAAGTNYAPGGMAYVHQDELISLPRGSQVIPSHAVRAMANMRPQGGGGASVNQHFHLHAEGAVMTDQLMANLDARAKRYAATAYGEAVKTAAKQAPTAVQRAQMYRY